MSFASRTQRNDYRLFERPDYRQVGVDPLQQFAATTDANYRAVATQIRDARFRISSRSRRISSQERDLSDERWLNRKRESTGRQEGGSVFAPPVGRNKTPPTTFDGNNVSFVPTDRDENSESCAISFSPPPAQEQALAKSTPTVIPSRPTQPPRTDEPTYRPTPKSSASTTTPAIPPRPTELPRTNEPTYRPTTNSSTGTTNLDTPRVTTAIPIDMSTPAKQSQQGPPLAWQGTPVRNMRNLPPGTPMTYNADTDETILPLTMSASRKSRITQLGKTNSVAPARYTDEQSQARQKSPSLRQTLFGKFGKKRVAPQ